MERDIGAGWDYDEYNDGGDASFGASYTSESQTFHKNAALRAENTSLRTALDQAQRVSQVPSDDP